MPASVSADVGGAVATATPVRTVRLKRGQQPTHSSLTGFQRWCWKTFQRRVLAKPPDPILEENLLKAHMRIRADEFMATVYATAVVTAIATVVAGAVLGFILVSSGQFLFGVLIGVALPVFGTIGAFFGLQGTPASTAKTRGRKIDQRITWVRRWNSASISSVV